MLLQLQNLDKDLRPVGVWSRLVNDTEQQYDTIRRECFALVWAVLLLRLTWGKVDLSFAQTIRPISRFTLNS